MSSLAQSNEIPAPVADDVPSGGHHPQGAHAVPKRVLLGVYGLLCLLTAITVGVSLIDLGPANIWVALFVAVIKGGLVVMYFMHLRWDSPFNGVVLIAAMFFVALFIGIAMLDSKEYQPNLEKPEIVQQYSAADTGSNLPNGPKPPMLPSALTGDQVKDILAADVKETPASKLNYDDVVAAAEKDPGDAELGVALFQNRGCVNCHTLTKDQAPRAPYLGDVTARHDKAYIFESILRPSAKIADGFANNLFQLKDKTILQGFLIAESDDSDTIRDTNGLVTVIPKSMIKKHRVLPDSLMPAGLGDNLTVHDLASLYAFLDSLNKTSVAEK